MRKRWMRCSIVVGLVVVLAGCASMFGSGQNAAPVLIATGETLDLARGQFVTVAGVMNALYDTKTITSAQYDPWRQFVPRFKDLNPKAVKLWIDAKHVCSPPPPAVLNADDCTLQSEAAKANIGVLATELAALATDAYKYVATTPATPAAVKAK